jgi:hypothetical protein
MQKREKPGRTETASESRKKRLAEALRANLRRRKQGTAAEAEKLRRETPQADTSAQRAQNLC